MLPRRVSLQAVYRIPGTRPWHSLKDRFPRRARDARLGASSNLARAFVHRLGYAAASSTPLRQSLSCKSKAEQSELPDIDMESVESRRKVLHQLAMGVGDSPTSSTWSNAVETIPAVTQWLQRLQASKTRVVGKAGSLQCASVVLRLLAELPSLSRAQEEIALRCRRQLMSEVNLVLSSSGLRSKEAALHAVVAAMQANVADEFPAYEEDKILPCDANPADTNTLAGQLKADAAAAARPAALLGMCTELAMHADEGVSAAGLAAARALLQSLSTRLQSSASPTQPVLGNLTGIGPGSGAEAGAGGGGWGFRTDGAAGTDSRLAVTRRRPRRSKGELLPVRALEAVHDINTLLLQRLLEVSQQRQARQIPAAADQVLEDACVAAEGCLDVLLRVPEHGSAAVEAAGRTASLCHQLSALLPARQHHGTAAKSLEDTLLSWTRGELSQAAGNVALVWDGLTRISGLLQQPALLSPRFRQGLASALEAAPTGTREQESAAVAVAVAASAAAVTEHLLEAACRIMRPASISRPGLYTQRIPLRRSVEQVQSRLAVAAASAAAASDGSVSDGCCDDAHVLTPTGAGAGTGALKPSPAAVEFASRLATFALDRALPEVLSSIASKAAPPETRARLLQTLSAAAGPLAPCSASSLLLLRSRGLLSDVLHAPWDATSRKPEHSGLPHDIGRAVAACMAPGGPSIVSSRVPRSSLARCLSFARWGDASVPYARTLPPRAVQLGHIACDTLALPPSQAIPRVLSLAGSTVPSHVALLARRIRMAGCGSPRAMTAIDDTLAEVLRRSAPADDFSAVSALEAVRTGLQAFAGAQSVVPAALLHHTADLLRRCPSALRSADTALIGELAAFSLLACGPRPERQRLLDALVHETIRRVKAHPRSRSGDAMGSEAVALSLACRAAIRAVAFSDVLALGALPGLDGTSTGVPLRHAVVDEAWSCMPELLRRARGAMSLSGTDDDSPAASYTLLATLAHGGAAPASGEGDERVKLVVDAVGADWLLRLRRAAVHSARRRRQAAAPTPPLAGSAGGTLEQARGGVQVSAMQLSLSSALRSLPGCPPVVDELFSTEPPLMIDIAMPSCKTAVEVDGPWHYQIAAPLPAEQREGHAYRSLLQRAQEEAEASMREPEHAPETVSTERDSQRGRPGRGPTGEAPGAAPSRSALAELPAGTGPDEGRGQAAVVQGAGAGALRVDWRLLTSLRNEGSRARELLLRQAGWEVAVIGYEEWQAEVHRGRRGSAVGSAVLESRVVPVALRRQQEAETTVPGAVFSPNRLWHGTELHQRERW